MRERAPAPALRRWVRSYTGYRVEPAPAGTHQGVASPRLTLLLCLDGKVEVLANADPTRPPGAFTAMVGGLHPGPAVVAQGAAQTGVQLDLTWRGARALLGVPAGELAGDSVDLAALLGARAEGLLDRLAAAPTWPQRFALLDEELAALAACGPGDGAVAPEVAHAWDRLDATGGLLPVEALVREVGWSRRHLAARLRAETGLAPKAAARVIRFGRACERLRRGEPLAAVAADCGYADQQHLARDFRDLAGQTATSWRAERAYPSGSSSGPAPPPPRMR